MRPQEADSCCVQCSRQDVALLWCEKKMCFDEAPVALYVSTGYPHVIYHDVFEGMQHCCNCKLHN